MNQLCGNMDAIPESILCSVLEGDGRKVVRDMLMISYSMIRATMLGSSVSKGRNVEKTFGSF